LEANEVQCSFGGLNLYLPSEIRKPSNRRTGRRQAKYMRRRRDINNDILLSSHLPRNVGDYLKGATDSNRYLSLSPDPSPETSAPTNPTAEISKDVIYTPNLSGWRRKDAKGCSLGAGAAKTRSSWEATPVYAASCINYRTKSGVRPRNRRTPHLNALPLSTEPSSAPPPPVCSPTATRVAPKASPMEPGYPNA